MDPTQPCTHLQRSKTTRTDMPIGSKLGGFADWTAALFAVAACSVTAWSAWQHLKHYKRPDLQRSSLRIMLMVPIYAISSWTSLWATSEGVASSLEVVRDVYEAVVIFVFFHYLLQLLNGERALLLKLQQRPAQPQLWPCNYCFAPVHIGDPVNFLWLKRGVLQFIAFKPIHAALTLLLKACGVYQEGYIAWSSPYAWISFFYNVSVSLAMYALLMFFFATQHDLQEHQPGLKLLCVKSVVFFTFWQGLVISFLVSMGIIKENNDHSAGAMAVAYQDFCICIELLVIALAHLQAFGHESFASLPSARLPLNYAIRDAVGFVDIVQDSYQTMLGLIDTTPIPHASMLASANSSTEGLAQQRDTDVDNADEGGEDVEADLGEESQQVSEKTSLLQYHRREHQAPDSERSGKKKIKGGLSIPILPSLPIPNLRDISAAVTGAATSSIPGSSRNTRKPSPSMPLTSSARFDTYHVGTRPHRYPFANQEYGGTGQLLDLPSSNASHTPTIPPPSRPGHGYSSRQQRRARYLGHIVEAGESLTFDDLPEDPETDPMEDLYRRARLLPHGDYNYPVISD